MVSVLKSLTPDIVGTVISTKLDAREGGDVIGFVEFVERLSPEIRAELLAVLWLGQEKGKRSEYEIQMRYARRHLDDCGEYLDGLQHEMLIGYLLSGMVILMLPGLSKHRSN